MVLRPFEADVPTSANKEPRPAWAVVAERQKYPARSYWLISQPDHANLSGDLAGNFVSARFPSIGPLMARAIGAHDAGWAMFPQEASPLEPPLLNAEGKPLAFLEFGVEEFLQAWTGSIKRAENICPAGGIIVSQHFCDLGSFRLRNGERLQAGEMQLIHAFIAREQERQRHLREKCSCPPQELETLLEVLQFCDLLSLYLCSGAREEAEFPQRLTDRTVRIFRPPGESLYYLDPSPFQDSDEMRTVSVGVTARWYQPGSEPKLTTLGFVIV